MQLLLISKMLFAAEIAGTVSPWKPVFLREVLTNHRFTWPFGASSSYYLSMKPSPVLGILLVGWSKPVSPEDIRDACTLVGFAEAQAAIEGGVVQARSSAL